MGNISTGIISKQRSHNQIFLQTNEENCLAEDLNEKINKQLPQIQLVNGFNYSKIRYYQLLNHLNLTQLERAGSLCQDSVTERSLIRFSSASKLQSKLKEIYQIPVSKPIKVRGILKPSSRRFKTVRHAKVNFSLSPRISRQKGSVEASISHPSITEDQNILNK